MSVQATNSRSPKLSGSPYLLWMVATTSGLLVVIGGIPPHWFFREAGAEKATVLVASWYVTNPPIPGAATHVATPCAASSTSHKLARPADVITACILLRLIGCHGWAP